MKNNFKTNLLIGFGASLLILMMTSVASYFSISNLLTSADLVSHTNSVIQELNDVKSGVVDAETGQRGYLLTGESEFLDPYNDSRARVEASFQNVRGLTTDNPKQQSILEELGEQLEIRFTQFDSTIEVRKSGRVISIETLRKNKANMDRIRTLIQTLQENEKSLLEERTVDMNRFAGYTPTLIIIGAVLALVITILFYARMRTDFEQRLALQKALEDKDVEISTRINIIKGIADKISQGSYDIRVDDKQTDSLGSVSVSLNKMASSLEYSFGLLSDKEWVQTGVAQLNDVVIGEKPVEQLCEDVLEYVAGYTHSNAGALYLASGDELHIVKGFALVQHASRSKVKHTEGILGQSVATGKIIELKNLPSDSINISFITGEARPNHVVAVPLFADDLITGAIELATLSSYHPREIEFLKECMSRIGIAINSAQNRRKLQELLEETQSQAEELKTQHTDLENMNNELEVQAEKLQASEEELKVQQEELKQANQELEERSRLLEERNQVISERNIDIQTKADQLSQSTRYKSEFLANMSHELRTPLNSILLLSRLISENMEKNLTAEQVEYAKVIQSSGNGLLSLIDEILDLSKIESGKMQLEYHSVTVKEITSGMQALFNPIANEKNVEFRILIEADIPAVIETDKLRFEQILKNLISNAIKFTEKGHVSLSISNDKTRRNYLRFAVKDTGIGIPKEKQQLIFEAFQQADGSTRRKFGGTGLGLSISRELARLLGGEITLQSETGAGSEFIVSIPALKGAFIEVPVTETTNEIFSVKAEQPIKTGSAFRSTHIPENIPDDRNDIKEGERSILIIEDDLNFAKSLLDYARRRNYKALVAVRGDEGIELAKQFLPVGILLDIQLPVKSGWEVMEELKADSETRHIPVHIMSSYEAKNESLQKGAVDFINKPVAFEQLTTIFEKIEYVLKQHPKKVLIVEENAKHAKALAYFLETFDLSMEIKSNVDDAIQSLTDKATDCVILDMGIPDQRSYDTLEEVKKTPGLENIPIIIFTGKSLSQTEERKIRQYADSIVVKTAHSYKRILDEVSLFLHVVEKKEGSESITQRYHKLGMMDEVLKNKTVLIADDDMRNIFSLTKALEKYKMNVIAAVDGKDAVDKLKANPKIDIVLMDMMMPEMDGYESTETIRKDARFKNLPVIAVTAKAMMGDRAKCINAGASDYITKPVDLDQLFSLLRVWLYEKK